MDSAIAGSDSEAVGRGPARSLHSRTSSRVGGTGGGDGRGRIMRRRSNVRNTRLAAVSIKTAAHPVRGRAAGGARAGAAARAAEVRRWRRWRWILGPLLGRPPGGPSISGGGGGLVGRRAPGAGLGRRRAPSSDRWRALRRRSRRWPRRLPRRPLRHGYYELLLPVLQLRLRVGLRLSVLLRLLPYYYGYGGYPYYYGYYRPTATATATRRTRYGYPSVTYGEGYAPYAADRASLGAVAVKVRPRTAEVYVDGRYVGAAGNFDGFPGYLWIAPGQHRIVLVQNGYANLEQEIEVGAGQVVELEQKLEHGVAVRPEPPADGPRYSRGRTEASYRYPTATAARDERPSESATDLAELVLDVRPDDASVYLDGRFVGTGRDVSTATEPAGDRAGRAPAPGRSPRLHERRADGDDRRRGGEAGRGDAPPRRRRLSALRRRRSWAARRWRPCARAAAAFPSCACRRSRRPALPCWG